MIKVTVYVDDAGEYRGFNCSGHSGYAESGNDIICAAVSALAINLANSVEALTKDRFSCSIVEESGDFDFLLEPEHTDMAGLLLSSCILGIRNIQSDYGKKYINITNREVK